MSDYEDLTAKGRKMSRLEREQEKIRVAQANINRLLATEKEKQRKYDTRRKVLLGVMFQEMIVEGRIPDKLFNEFLEKYLNERDRSVFDGYLQEFSTWKPSSGSPVKTTPRPDSVDL